MRGATAAGVVTAAVPGVDVDDLPVGGLEAQPGEELELFLLVEALARRSG
jgi:hypothetical protein